MRVSRGQPAAGKGVQKRPHTIPIWGDLYAYFTRLGNSFSAMLIMVLIDRGNLSTLHYFDPACRPRPAAGMYQKELDCEKHRSQAVRR